MTPISEDYQLPRAFVVNRLDRDGASFDRSVQSLRTHFGRVALPIQSRKRHESARH